MVANTPIKPTPGTAAEGNYVLETQPLAVDEGFQNVAKAWFDKTISIEQALEQLLEGQHQRKTVTASLARMEPIENAGRFAIAVRGNRYFFDEYSVGQLGSHLQIGAQYPRHLLQSKQPGAAEALVYAAKHAMAGIDESKTFTFHVENDVVRGMLPEWSFQIRNDWYLRLLSRLIPGGRVSHHRGDAYTLFANVLVPDTIRTEADSDYGALVATQNSQIGVTKFIQCPSLFRAICMNGCRWGETRGKAITFARGHAHDLVALEELIAKNITQQIEIATRELDTLLGTRSFITDVAMKPVIAQVAADCSLNKANASAVLGAWWTERSTTPDYANSLFGVVNAVTRAAQTLDIPSWVKFDELGGKLAAMERIKWDSLVARASKLSRAEVDARFAPWALSV